MELREVATPNTDMSRSSWRESAVTQVCAGQTHQRHAQYQRQHQQIPPRSPTQPHGEIEPMKPLEPPTIGARIAIELGDQIAADRVQIVSGTVRIVCRHAIDGERSRFMATVVVV